MKTVRFLLMHDRLRVEALDGKFERDYKVKPRFQGEVIKDMKFAGLIPDSKTISNFPWLKQHFPD